MSYNRRETAAEREVEQAASPVEYHFNGKVKFPATYTQLVRECERLQDELVQRKAEIVSLRLTNHKLREISLRRFIGCMCGGEFDGAVLVPNQWHWSCSLCGAESTSSTDAENLDHKADCPILWIREQAWRRA